MAESRNTHSEDPLEAALFTAFSSVPPPPPSTEKPAEASIPISVPEISTSEAGTSDDSWKSEYESHLTTWKSQSAEAREKAEKERGKWEAIRAAEAAQRKAAGIEDPVEPLHGISLQSESGWESVATKSSSPTDARDLVSGEVPREFKPHVAPSTADESQKWEELPSSLTSSYPSMTFPENTPPTEHQTGPTPFTQPFPLAATVSIFDSSLSTRTRLAALASSVAINMLLPFVNGVMLGFGEIFAKNVLVKWIGWKVPGSTSKVGLGVRRPLDRKDR